MKQKLFKEKHLIFDGPKPQSLFNLKKSPTEWNAEAVNPHESIANFEAAEAKHAEKAWQHPLKDAVTDNIKDAKEMLHAALYPAQAGLNMVKSIVGETSEAVSQVLSKWVKNPLKIVGRSLMAPFAFIANNMKRIPDLAVKYPFSALNITGSMIGRPFLAASSLFKKGYGKMESAGEAIAKKISGISSGVRGGIDKLKIPGMAQLQPA